jgi:hypothetical protein
MVTETEQEKHLTVDCDVLYPKTVVEVRIKNLLVLTLSNLDSIAGKDGKRTGRGLFFENGIHCQFLNFCGKERHRWKTPFPLPALRQR